MTRMAAVQCFDGPVLVCVKYGDGRSILGCLPAQADQPAGLAGPNQSKAHCNRPQDQNAHRLNIIWFTTRFYPVYKVYKVHRLIFWMLITRARLRPSRTLQNTGKYCHKLQNTNNRSKMRGNCWDH